MAQPIQQRLLILTGPPRGTPKNEICLTCPVSPQKHRLRFSPPGKDSIFFGFLGWFRSQQPNKLVGFAQIYTVFEAGKLLDIIELTVKSSTPDIIFRLSLETPDDPDKCTFQANIPTTTSFEKRIFIPADFTCWRRGERLPVDRLVSFEDVNKMTFLVTRSSQREPTSTSESLAPFELQISALNFR